MNQKISSKRRKSKFFLVLGFIGLFAVLAGFLKTFIVPVSKGDFKAPTIIFIHGFFAAAWVVLFVVQSFLIQKNKYKTHMTLGYLGLVIALGAGLTIIPAGFEQVKRELGLGFGEIAISGIVGVFTTAIMYLSLVAMGLWYRKNGAAHKRLMALATLVLLWPAWFRFRHYFPSVPRPDIWFAVVLADSFIILGILWDKWTNKKVHWTFLYLGLLIIAEHVFEVLTFDSELWRWIANCLYNLFI